MLMKEAVLRFEAECGMVEETVDGRLGEATARVPSNSTASLDNVQVSESDRQNRLRVAHKARQQHGVVGQAVFEDALPHPSTATCHHVDLCISEQLQNTNSYVAPCDKYD